MHVMNGQMLLLGLDADYALETITHENCGMCEAAIDVAVPEARATGAARFTYVVAHHKKGHHSVTIARVQP